MAMEGFELQMGDEQAISIGAARVIIGQIVTGAMSEFTQQRDAISSHRDAIYKMHGDIQKWNTEFLEMVTTERVKSQEEFDKIKAYLKEKHDEHDVLNDLVSATKDEMDDWAIKFRQDIVNTFATQQQTIDEAKQHIQELAARHRDGGEGAGEGGQRGGSGGRERRFFRRP